MANRFVKIDQEANDGCEKSNYNVYSNTFTKETYEDDEKIGECWKKDEEMNNRRLMRRSISSESSDEDTVNENRPSQLQSGKGNSEETGVDFQELMTNKPSCQESDVKPTHSYIALIAMAILSSSSKKMILGDIYEYISDNFPYYRNKDKSWRNSIRHNLSLNECFIKAGRSENGKGNYWAIHPANLEDFANGDFRRRRARRRVRKSSALKFASGTAAYLRSLSMFSPIHHNSMFSLRTSDYQMFSHPYLPGQERKNLAMDAIMSSYEIPSSQLCSSNSTHNLHHTSFNGVPSGGGMLQSYTKSSCPTRTPYLGQQTTSKEANFKIRRLQDGLLSSAFIPYSTSTSHSFSSESESWQETLSKLQEQLKKAT